MFMCGSGKGVITADVHPKVFDLSFTQLMPVQVYYQCHCFFSFLPVTAPNRNKFFRISERIVYISKWKIFLCLLRSHRQQKQKNSSNTLNYDELILSIDGL